MNRFLTTTFLLAAASSAACGSSKKSEAGGDTTPTTEIPGGEAAPSVKLDRVPRADFNRLAVRLNLPLYWIADKNSDGAVDPDEVASLRFYPTSGAWVEGGKFTAAFGQAYEQIASAKAAKPGDARQELVGVDLDGGRATLVYNDLTGLPDDHKQMVKHVLAAADKIDALFEKIAGITALEDKLPGDPASHSLFRRNRGPECVTPKAEKDPACSALPDAAKPKVDVYPAELLADADFCKKIEGRKDSKALLSAFTVVRADKDGKLSAVPYNVAYKDDMAAISADLTAAAEALVDPKEAPMRAYLSAAAKAFLDNNWEPADEAWAKMDSQNSKWYLRIAPDEVYWEPCAHKAGFHVSFALIEPEFVVWQQKLTPIQQDMEKAVATLAGKPYKERKVGFHLPDVINIVVNAGDSRGPLGATIGQSLPNVGKVADESRGRTVAMANLYADVDSIEARKAQAASLLDAESMKLYAAPPVPGLLSTILHEACHNLGPSHQYKAFGKTDDQAFGGPIASVMEELKAQTCGLFLVELVRGKGVFTDQLAHEVYVDSIVWAFGHISQGMYTGGGERKPYSQLAAIQMGILIQEGALVWNPEATAANGKDKGAFTVNFAKLVPAIDKMTKVVAGIKARGDKPGAEKLIKDYVDGEVVPKAIIAERFLRFPKASFVFAYDL